MSYQGKALLSPGSSAPMYLGSPGSPGGSITFAPSPGPGLTPDRPLNLQGSILGSPVRTDSAGTFTYLGAGNGSSAQEWYLAYDPADPSSTAAIQPGGAVILKNKVGRRWLAGVKGAGQHPSAALLGCCLPAPRMPAHVLQRLQARPPCCCLHG
jgi:hypothetical protein